MKEELIKYVMEKADKYYSDVFPINSIEDWIREFFDRYHRERLSPEALYNEDGSLNNPKCNVCGLGKWSSLHQGCDSPNTANK